MIGTTAITRPGFIADEHLAYLDDVKEAGVTNMWGATPYIKVRFPELTHNESNEVLVYWMNKRDQESTE